MTPSKQATVTETTSQLTPIAVSDLSEKLASHRISMPLLRQVLISYQANLRRSTASTLKRGEVSGGGKKPWRQKGTGRARVGSSRTPVWRGGGIVFGPSTAKNYTQSITKTAKLRSLADAILLKVKAGKISRVELTTIPARTKDVIKLLGDSAKGRYLLVVAPEMSYAQGFRNIPGARVLTVPQLTAANISIATNVLFINDTWDNVKAKFE